MSDKTMNVLVVGVGGQGVILASDIMSEVFMEAGFDVKKSEIHGMAMRGGDRQFPFSIRQEGLLPADQGRRGGYSLRL